MSLRSVPKLWKRKVGIGLQKRGDLQNQSQRHCRFWISFGVPPGFIYHALALEPGKQSFLSRGKDRVRKFYEYIGTSLVDTISQSTSVCWGKSDGPAVSFVQQKWASRTLCLVLRAWWNKLKSTSPMIHEPKDCAKCWKIMLIPLFPFPPLAVSLAQDVRVDEIWLNKKPPQLLPRYGIALERKENGRAHKSQARKTHTPHLSSWGKSSKWTSQPQPILWISLSEHPSLRFPQHRVHWLQEEGVCIERLISQETLE